MNSSAKRTFVLALALGIPTVGVAIAASAVTSRGSLAARVVPAIVAETVPATARETAASPQKKAAPQQRGRRTRRTSAARRSSARPASAAARWTSPVGEGALATDLGNMLLAKTRGGDWGAIVVSITRGDTLFAHNANAMLQPASTMKMFTAALALEHFGPDYSFRTAVLREGEIGADGVMQGNLYLRGSGDPSLSPRYFRDESPMDYLARQIAGAGIKRVHGDVVGDATLFENRTVPEGWQSRYLGAAYAARVGALSLNENLVWVVVQPNGKTASVTLDPATTTLPVQSTVRVTGGSGGRISAARGSDGVIHVRGTIGANSVPRRYSLVVDDPTLFTAGALRASLEKFGVVVDGSVRSGATPEGATEVTYVASPPLSRIVSSMNRESINVFAELSCCSGARHTRSCPASRAPRPRDSRRFANS
jgi:serine-type D-Ala-D-Ala carboxypeptidase/endopeptidase (penicillin-binding protein 4)